MGSRGHCCDAYICIRAVQVLIHRTSYLINTYKNGKKKKKKKRIKEINRVRGTKSLP
jgi:hypothetical protein